jgi:hypothetical protein
MPASSFEASHDQLPCRHLWAIRRRTPTHPEAMTDGMAVEVLDLSVDDAGMGTLTARVPSLAEFKAIVARLDPGTVMFDSRGLARSLKLAPVSQPVQPPSFPCEVREVLRAAATRLLGVDVLSTAGPDGLSWSGVAGALFRDCRRLPDGTEVVCAGRRWGNLPVCAPHCAMGSFAVTLAAVGR